MGQQQLLLVILVTIIVGIATVVAINTFSAASESANVDAVRSDLLSVAASAQQYYMKPTALGGGGQEFTGISVTNLGAVPGEKDASAGTITNENGTYTLGAVGTDNFIMQATPATAGGGIQIRVCPDDAVMGDYAPDAADGSAATAPGSCPTS